MVNTLPIPQNLVTDDWVQSTWNSFLELCDPSRVSQGDRPDLEKAKFYYDDGWMRIEIMPTGSGHSQDNTLLSQVVSLFGMFKSVRIKGFTGGSFRRAGLRECQPDLAFYIADEIPDPFPPKTTEPIDVEKFGAPTLAIEISASTLNDDLGKKRLLYERFGVREYWVVDVQSAIVIAFAVADGGSRQIQASQVLRGLSMGTIEEALRRSQTEDDTQINHWLMQQFQTTAN
ncbi:MAG: Uma2 family endonuclease [Chitinophagaceae bacterium]|nr:Uma2 family endonuclease [Anaerolineae bacterium]